MPKVTVILPTYNRSILISRAIESVLNQSYQDFELIVIDDGSTDDTHEKVNFFKNEKITYIKQKINIGAAAARNIGINIAKGDFLAFQDSDNEWLPGKLERQMAEFQKAPKEVGVVYVGEWRIRGEIKTFVPNNNHLNKEGDIHNELLRGNFVDLPASVVRKECLLRFGQFDGFLPCLQEWELWIRISKDYQFKFVNEPLLYAYYSPDSISLHSKKRIRAWEYILSKHADKYIHCRDLLASNYIKLAHLECMHGDCKKIRRFLLRALKSSPLHKDAIFFMLLSFLGQTVYRKYIS